MANIKGLKKRLNIYIWNLRKRINNLSPKIKICQNSGISVISCNCTGGVVLSELNMRFNTPTINEFMSAEDFLMFSENIEYYITAELKPAPISIQTTYDYPLAILGNDIYIHAVHYKSFDEFKNKWVERCARVNLNKLFFIFSDRDGFSEDLLNRIAQIHHSKVLFSNREFPGYDFVCRIPGYDEKQCVGDLCAFRGITGKRVYSYFDFLNAFLKMEEETK